MSGIGKTIMAGVFCFTFAFFGTADTADAAEFKANTTGDWGVAANWDGGVPTGFARISASGRNNSIVTLRTVQRLIVGSDDRFIFGQGGLNGSLTIVSGGFLDTEDNTVHRIGQTSAFTVTVEAGGRLRVRSATTTSSAGSSLIVNGGRVDLRNYQLSNNSSLIMNGGLFTYGAQRLDIRTGSSVIINDGDFDVRFLDNDATFVINGSTATIDAVTWARARANSTFVFNLDANGISPVKVRNQSFSISSGAKLVVDASAYCATAGETITLVDASVLDGAYAPGDYTVTGLGTEGTDWTLSQGPNGDIAINVITDKSPVADAGLPQSVACGNVDPGVTYGTATLDASNSTDAQNDILTYEWFDGLTSLGTGVMLEVDLDYIFPGPTTYTIDLIVTDATGCQSIDSVDVTVFDNDAPSLVVFPGRTLQCGVERAGERFLMTPFSGGPTLATDACDALVGVTVTRTNPDLSTATATYYSNGTSSGDTAGFQANLGQESGVTTWDYSTTDLSGNTITAQGQTTIVDTIAPTITCPNGVAIECPWDGSDFSVAANGTATAVDVWFSPFGAVICDPNPTVTFVDGPETTDSCGLRTFTRTWTATDESNNSSSCDQVFVEIDIVDPVLSGVPADVAVECDAVPAPSNLTASDACDNANGLTVDGEFMGDDRTDGACAGTYTILRSWRAEDCSGNYVEASQVITVVDTTAPSISAPDDATVECGGDTSPSATGTATANDGCGGAVTVGYSDSSVAGLGNTETITRTWTATDDCGNSSSDVQTITVEDTTNPSISVPDDATVECTDDTSPASTGSATGSDTCGSVSIGYSDSSVPGPGNTETITRTWTVTDESNNESSDVQTITVVDTTAPVLDGVPADATVECDAVPAVATVTALDSCDGALDVDFTENSTVGNCAAESVITRTWSAVDGSGNDSTASQVITVVDTTAPVLGAAPTDVTVECSADIPAMTSVGYTDNCGASGSVAGSDSASVDACGNGTITRTWDVSDECGNPAATVTQVITVIDTIAPVLMIPGDTAVPICGTTFDVTAGVSASDNCGGDLTSSVVVGGSVDTGAVGCYSVTYDVSDCTGNPAAQQSRDVLVPYNIEGLLQPLNDQTVSVVASSAASGEALNLDCSGLKNIKAKRGGLPLKIRLTDCNGNTVTDALLGGAEPKVTSILTLGGPDGNEIVDLVNPESTGNSNLPDGTMRISDDKWIYTLDVDDTGSSGLSAGCYAAEFTITLPGGCAVYAYAAFKLK